MCKTEAYDATSAAAKTHHKSQLVNVYQWMKSKKISPVRDWGRGSTPNAAAT